MFVTVVHHHGHERQITRDGNVKNNISYLIDELEAKTTDGNMALECLAHQ